MRRTRNRRVRKACSPETPATSNRKTAQGNRRQGIPVRPARQDLPAHREIRQHRRTKTRHRRRRTTIPTRRDRATNLAPGQIKRPQRTRCGRFLSGLTEQKETRAAPSTFSLMDAHRLARAETWTSYMKKPQSVHRHIDRHSGAFFAIACFAVACTMLSAIAAGAQTGTGTAGTGTAAGSTSTTTPGTVPNTTPPTPGVVTPSTTTPVPGTLTTTPANSRTPAVTPAPIGTTSCAPSATGCVPGTTPPPNGMNPPPSTAYPINPPAGNGQPGP